MRILFALTYYRPHVSGLTIYVQRIAEALAARGHQVSVLTSQHAPALPEQETVNGVRVVRVPVAARFSKGVLMPAYPIVAGRLLRGHDVVIGNLPNTPLEALVLPLLARLMGRPVAMTYHCDLQLPAGTVNRFIDGVVALSNGMAVALSDRVVAYTDDYANHSPVLRNFPKKRVVIPPPVEMPQPKTEQVEAFRQRYDLDGRTVVGFVARFAAEKGIAYALAAIPRLLERRPSLKVLFAGEYRKVVGESAYWDRLQPLLQRYAEAWQFTGVLEPTDPAQLASFYAACDVTILPSINSTESFGLVQVESMLCGTPVVASNLPGVRQPVTVTGMGRIVPVRDSSALAEAILEVIEHRERYVRPRQDIASVYSTERTAGGYESLLRRLMERRVSGPGRRATSPDRRDYLADHLKDVPAFRALLRGVECRLFERAGRLEEPILDVGCGDGHFASMAFEQPIFTGIDQSERMVREAQQRGSYRAPVVADARRLPYSSDSFPTVVGNCSIEHVPDVEAAIGEIARVLRPGGRFIFGVPSHRFGDYLLGSTVLRRLGLARLGQAYGDWFNRISVHYTTDDPDRWKERLKRHGLVIDHWEYYVSPAGHRAFDLAHYLGVPRLISRKLTGRWLAFPNPLANAAFAAWLRPYYEEGPPSEGAYIFFHARKPARPTD